MNFIPKPRRVFQSGSRQYPFIDITKSLYTDVWTVVNVDEKGFNKTGRLKDLKFDTEQQGIDWLKAQGIDTTPILISPLLSRLVV